MTTEGEGDNVEAIRSMRRKRVNATLNTILNSDDENSISGTSDDGSSEDEWKSSRKKRKTRQPTMKRGPVRTLKKMLAERTKNLKMNFDRTRASPESPPVQKPDSKDTKPDTTTAPTETMNLSDTEEKKPILAVVCDMIEKVAAIPEENETEDLETKELSSVATVAVVDVLKCDSSIKIEQADTEIKVKDEVVDPSVETTNVKNVKPDNDQDADTVILLSDDENDDESNVPKTVVLNCSILQTYASPILVGNEIPSSPTTPKIRVKPIDEISNSPLAVNAVNSSTIGPCPPFSPVSPRAPGIPFSSAGTPTISPSSLPTEAPNFPPAIASPRARCPRGSSRGPRQSSRTRGGTYRPRASPDVKCLTPRGRGRGRQSSTYSSRSPVTPPSRLDAISLENISPGGTIIRTGANSVTITPSKKNSETPPVQRKLFKNEIEGVISARDTGYVVNLANGTFLPLSDVQVLKLREQHNGILPTKLRIPVPSDVAATIEPRILIED